jgi:hypothetical protein
MCIPFLFTTAMIAKLQLNQKRQIDTPCTQIHDRSLCWIDTDSSIKIDWVKLVFVCAQTCPLCEKNCVEWECLVTVPKYTSCYFPTNCSISQFVDNTIKTNKYNMTKKSAKIR